MTWNNVRLALRATCVCATVAAFVALATPAFAQTTGQVIGSIVDAQGGVLPGVTVSATSPQLQGMRTAVTDSSGTFRFPTLPPGTYTVTLKAGGVEQSQKLEVRKDPNSGGTEGDIAAQTAALLALRTSLNQAADAVHRVESVRVQLEAIARTVDDAALKKASVDLGAKLVEAEMDIVDLRQTGTGQDGVRFGSKLVSKLGYLSGGIAASDYKPTNQHDEVRTILVEELRADLQRIDGLLGAELDRLNALLKSRSVPNVIVPTPKPIGL